MNDFTKIKLINSLIDVVERFYTLKNAGDNTQSKHLKGFCEGMSYTLIELEYLSSEDASRILKGFGKKEKLPEALTEAEMIFKPDSHTDDLDIPTFIRKK